MIIIIHSGLIVPRRSPLSSLVSRRALILILMRVGTVSGRVTFTFAFPQITRRVPSCSSQKFIRVSIMVFGMVLLRGRVISLVFLFVRLIVIIFPVTVVLTLPCQTLAFPMTCCRRFIRVVQSTGSGRVIKSIRRIKSVRWQLTWLPIITLMTFMFRKIQMIGRLKRSSMMKRRQTLINSLTLILWCRLTLSNRRGRGTSRPFFGMTWWRGGEPRPPITFFMLLRLVSGIRDKFALRGNIRVGRLTRRR